MKVYKTTKYFNITSEEAAEIIDDVYEITREEAKVLDEGVEHHFYRTYRAMRKDFNSKFYRSRIKEYGYEVLFFKFVSDNDNHNKYCMVFR